MEPGHTPWPSTGGGSSWPTVKHFTSWLGLCPNWKKTGGKVQSSKTRKGKNRVALAQRLGLDHRRLDGSRLGIAAGGKGSGERRWQFGKEHGPRWDGARMATRLWGDDVDQLCAWVWPASASCLAHSRK